MHVWFGYDITVRSAPILQPLNVQFWKEETYLKFAPQPPFLYKADALVGLSLALLHPSLPLPNSKHSSGKRDFVESLWNELEPHHEMFLRAQNRVEALRQNLKPTPIELVREFEAGLNQCLKQSLTPNGIDFVQLESLIDFLEFFEARLKKNLLFHFQLRFPKELNRSLQYLYSLLFHTRNLMVMDFNSNVQDPSHEGLKVDSVSDYLPHADYLANDAVLFHVLQKRNIKDLRKVFHDHSNSGAVLIESLSPEFLQGLNEEEMAEALYLVQMDWLFGTDAGLLFRIREELYGLRDGFEQVFYRNVESSQMQEAHTLSANFQIKDSDLFPPSKAA